MDLESDVHETPDLPNPTLELISPDSFTGVDQDLTQLADGVHSVRFQQNGKAVSSSVLVKRSLSDITVSYSLDGVGYESIMNLTVYHTQQYLHQEAKDCRLLEQ